MSTGRGWTAPRPLPADGQRRPWLVIGEGAAQALELGLAEGGAAGDARLPAAVVSVADVHSALSALGETEVDGCIVSARVLSTRPRAALRSLRARLQSAPLLVFDGGDARSARRAAEDLGVPIWGRAPEATPEPSEAAEASATADPAPQSAAASGPVRPAEARRGRPGAKPLPRADARPQAPGAVDPGRFAEGCLERIGRPGSLVRFILRTLTEATNAGRITLMLREPDGGTLRLRAGRGIQPALVGKVRCALGVGVAGRVAALGRPVTGHGSQGGPRGYPSSAFVVLPLGKGEPCEGVLNLTGLPENRLPEDEVLRTWARIGRRAGSALRSARRLSQARAESSRDELTGLPNRRAFERVLGREIERARRTGTGLALALLDVDHFKAFNDRYGHQIGDQVLVQVAARLQEAFRETDLVARWGGEEFAVVLPGVAGRSAGEARVAVERARRSIAGRPFVLGPGLAPVRVTVSGGLAAYPRAGTEATAVVQAADAALYRAKDAGRDCIEGE